MKLISLFLLIHCNILFAQESFIKKIIEDNSIQKSAYQKKTVPAIQSVLIPCNFGKPDLNFAAIDPIVDSVEIVAIDLVFTDYPSKDDLKKLNSKRIASLVQQYPTLQNPQISWQIIRQMNGADKAIAQNLYHGFVVYYRAPQNVSSMASDTKILKEMLTPHYHVKPANRKGFIAADTMHLREQYEIEAYTKVQKMPVNDALEYLGLDPKEKVNYKNTPTVYVYEKPLDTASTVEKRFDLPEDSTVINVLDRMHWKKMNAVVDLTASMYPYTGQLLLWLKLNEDERNIHQFVFFNDGDNRDDDEKKPGNTGGIYITNSSNFEVVEKLAFKTMNRGNGGNIPENNMEALIAAQNSCIDCETLVMIADNFSSVSDFSLLNQVDKPVHIILCGVLEKVNTQFLDIARYTGGTLHIANQDFLDFKKMNEGDWIDIGDYRYKIVKGYFVKDSSPKRFN